MFNAKIIFSLMFFVYSFSSYCAEAPTKEVLSEQEHKFHQEEMSLILDQNIKTLNGWLDSLNESTINQNQLLLHAINFFDAPTYWRESLPFSEINLRSKKCAPCWQFLQLETLQALINKKADVNIPTILNGTPAYYPLSAAAKNGETALVKLLLDNKANPNIAALNFHHLPDKPYPVALYACKNPEMLSMFLKSPSFDINHSGQHYIQPTTSAMLYINTEVMLPLIEEMVHRGGIISNEYWNAIRAFFKKGYSSYTIKDHQLTKKTLLMLEKHQVQCDLKSKELAQLPLPKVLIDIVGQYAKCLAKIDRAKLSESLDLFKTVKLKDEENDKNGKKKKEKKRSKFVESIKNECIVS